jgi:phosphohistidine phosphatase
MKTLYLVRHAKSSWDESELKDEDRPLADRGERDAPEMGRRLAKGGARIDLILSSPAERARATAMIIAKKLGYKRKHIVVDERLYPGRADELLLVIRSLNDKLERVMLFGHNPALLELAHHLSREITRMPTCAVATLEFDAESWAAVGARTLERTALDYPKKGRSTGLAAAPGRSR